MRPGGYAGWFRQFHKAEWLASIGAADDSLAGASRRPALRNASVSPCT
jgi:hypothetical protein